MEQSGHPSSPSMPGNYDPGDDLVMPKVSVITEDTDVTKLADHEVYELNQELMDSSIPSRPLIDEITPLSTLYEEAWDILAFGEPEVAMEIVSTDVLSRLHSRTFCALILHLRTALAFAYMGKIMNVLDKSASVQSALSTLKATLQMLQKVGFETIVYEDFYSEFEGLVKSIQPPHGVIPLDEMSLLEAFQKPEVSNSIVVYLRLVTSAYIRLNEADLEPFLVHPELLNTMSASRFCEAFVEAPGKEADHVQIMALSKALALNLKITYLDGRSCEVNFVDFVHSEGHEDSITLLYRPGHYDILEQSNLVA